MPSRATVIRHSLDFAFRGELSATPDDRASLKRLRRFTPLQKTLTELLHRFRQRHPDAFAELKEPGRSQVIYGSALGELQVNMSQTAAISAGELPLSPVKFQRSVLNASYSQCAIGHGITAAATALSRGFLTTDAAIALADTLLTAGQCANVLVLVGDENTPAAMAAQGSELSKEQGKEQGIVPAVLAYGQALWLCRTATRAAGDYALSKISFQPNFTAAERTEAKASANAEADSSTTVESEAAFPTLHPWQPARVRRTINHRGEGYVSHWQASGNSTGAPKP